MNSFSIFILKVLRKLYTQASGVYHSSSPLQREDNPDKISDMIYNLLSSDNPCMIARFGSTEMNAIINFLGVNNHHSLWKFICGKQPEWWWNQNIMNQMQQWSGFYPPTPENMQRFGNMMMEDIPLVDILGSWLTGEFYFKDQLQNASLVKLEFLNPYWSSRPWTKILEGKKVLVIHPFAKTIKKQYERRELLFKNPDILPLFDLKILQAVQSLGGNSQFKNWFEALQWMKEEMNKTDYDICLIGCGAYGFPLAAHAKRQGKKAVHLGGALQLLFGIKGKRWENPHYGEKSLKRQGAYSSLMNEYWCYPSAEETPQCAQNVENNCYWK